MGFAGAFGDWPDPRRSVEMDHTPLRADPPVVERAAPAPAISPKSSAERSRERRVQLRRERLIAAWLRSLTSR
jgi:hypothetical protein